MSKFREFMQEKYMEAEKYASGVSREQEDIAEGAWNAAIELAIHESGMSGADLHTLITLRRLLTYSEG
jgi:hypothetical protein